MINNFDFPKLQKIYSGKVKEVFEAPDNKLLIVTTDRISAFDIIVGTIPFKGQILNSLSEFWFAQTSDIIVNHLIRTIGTNVSLVYKCDALPVEVVVRGYITGSTQTSLWKLYESGLREIYGYKLPDGLQKGDKLEEPLITPTTKSKIKDEPLTVDEPVELGLISKDEWETIKDVSLKLFARGQEVAAENGLTLVDTKYEFGKLGDMLMLIDEVHTPDSSRYLLNGAHVDKEILRLALIDLGYSTQNKPGVLPPDLVEKVKQAYRTVYLTLTGVDIQEYSEDKIKQDVEGYLK